MKTLITILIFISSHVYATDQVYTFDKAKSMAYKITECALSSKEYSKDVVSATFGKPSVSAKEAFYMVFTVGVFFNEFPKTVEKHNIEVEKSKILVEEYNKCKKDVLKEYGGK